MAMGIRIAAFLLIVILPIAWPWKLGLAVLALVLPYIAVVYANGGREPEPGANSPYSDAERRALVSGQKPGDGPDTRADQRREPWEGDPAEPRKPISGRIVGDDD